MTPEEQLTIYGQPLLGQETELDLVKLQRIEYLKQKLRRKLDLEPLGDTKDCLTDAIKGIILGWAIQQGIVTDTAIIDRFKAAISAQLEFYGGPDYIMAMLEANATKLATWMAPYYQAKVAILAAADVESVRQADIEESPA